MKNVAVNFSTKAEFSRRMVHNSVSFLKKELQFTLDELIINFINPGEMIRINSDYLNHTYLTDVITFNYSETKSRIDGEIYISVDQALRNSSLYGSSLKEEIIRLVTHGILHLLGYDDQTTKDSNVMKRKEDELLIKQKEIWDR